MKKVLLITFVLLFGFALAACSNTKEEASTPPDAAELQEEAESPAEEAVLEYPPENPFMTLTIPEGWQYDETQSTRSQVYITKIEKDSPEQFFQFNTSSDDAETTFNSEVEFWADTSKPRTILEDEMYGFYNCKRTGFLWNSAPSVTLYTAWDNNPDKSIEINCFCIDPEDPIIREMMQTVSFF